MSVFLAKFVLLEVPNLRDWELGIFDQKYLPSKEKSVLSVGYAPGPGTLLGDIFPLYVVLLKLLIQLFLYFDKKYVPFSLMGKEMGSNLI